MINIYHGGYVTSFGWLSCACPVCKTQSEETLIWQCFVHHMSWKQIIWAGLWVWSSRKHSWKKQRKHKGATFGSIAVTTFRAGHWKQLTKFSWTSFCGHQECLSNREPWEQLPPQMFWDLHKEEIRTCEREGTEAGFVPLSCTPLRLAAPGHGWLLHWLQVHERNVGVSGI